MGGSTAGGDCVNIGAFAAQGDNLDADGACASLDADLTQATSGRSLSDSSRTTATRP